MPISWAYNFPGQNKSCTQQCQREGDNRILLLKMTQQTGRWIFGWKYCYITTRLAKLSNCHKYNCQGIQNPCGIIRITWNIVQVIYWASHTTEADTISLQSIMSKIFVSHIPNLKFRRKAVIGFTKFCVFLNFSLSITP